MTTAAASISVLSSYYAFSSTLLAYLQACLPEKAAQTLLSPADSAIYRDLLSSTMIAWNLPSGGPKLFAAFEENIHESEWNMLKITRMATRKCLDPKLKGILALGYRHFNDWLDSRSRIPPDGILNIAPNSAVIELQESKQWSTLLQRSGPLPLLHLLNSTSIFRTLPNSCFRQICGRPIHDEPVLKPVLTTNKTASKRTRKRKKTVPAPPTIVIQAVSQDVPPQQSSSRALKRNLTGSFVIGDDELPVEKVYDQQHPHFDAPPAKRQKKAIKPFSMIPLNRRTILCSRTHSSKGKGSSSGLGSQHIFTRLPQLFMNTRSFSDTTDHGHGRHLLKHVFPLQFRLPSPLSETSNASLKLNMAMESGQLDSHIARLGTVKTPPRLSEIKHMLETAFKNHSECDYETMLNRHCPSQVLSKKLTPEDRQAFLLLDLIEPGTQLAKNDVSFDTTMDISNVTTLIAQQKGPVTSHKPRFADYVCSYHQVSRYVIDVVDTVFPFEIWGSIRNKTTVNSTVQALIEMRISEDFSLHNVTQNFSIADCEWLLPRSSKGRNANSASPAERLKQLELVSEFLYWFYTKFVFDIVKTAFYVTESGVYRNKSLYFRQDDFALLSRPLLDNLKQTHLVELSKAVLNDIQRKKIPRELGFAQVRLLPKEIGVRPIMNLNQKQKLAGKGEYRASINQKLRNIHEVFNYEKCNDPAIIGAGVSGHNEIYEKMTTYKTALRNKYSNRFPKLYIVKVDVCAAFDSIVHSKLLVILEGILHSDKYAVQTYSRVTATDRDPKKEFKRQATANIEDVDFNVLATEMAGQIRAAIFTDQARVVHEDRARLFTLLKEHISANLIKIGNKVYLQKVGIPQGSVLSYALCNFFFADMERKCFTFLDPSNDLLMRMVDDFLLVTPLRQTAQTFLQSMHKGYPEYGCKISAGKSMINFDAALDATPVEKVVGRDFPWCGFLIHQRTLDFKIDYAKQLKNGVGDSMTIAWHNKPGQALKESIFRAVRFRCQPLITDAAFNNRRTVQINIYQLSLLIAVRFVSYIKLWGAKVEQNPRFFLSIITGALEMMYVMIRIRCKSSHVRRLEINSLGKHAFLRILRRWPGGFDNLIKPLAVDLKSKTLASCLNKHRDIIKHASNMQFEGKVL